MEKTFIALLAGGLLLGSPGQGQDPQQEARAVIKKAIAAHGETYQGKRLARYSQVTGKLQAIPMKGERYAQPDGAFKGVHTLAVMDKEIGLSIVYNGKKGWMKIVDGNQVVVQEFQPADYDDIPHDEYLDRIGYMVDLLTDGSFVLSHLGAEKFAGQDVVGVLVTSKGQVDVRVYFDKTTDLMAGMRYKRKDRDGKEVLHEIVFSDYRELGLSDRDGAVLKRVGVALEGAAALAELRKLIPTKADEQAMRNLIDKLGNSSFKVREEATDQLKKLGARAIPLLRSATNNPDKEWSRRAEICLKSMENEGLDQVAPALVRLVGYSRPAEAVAVLLDYLPHAQDGTLAGEVKAVLVHLAQDSGKPHPVLLQALQAKEELRRETAAAVLGKDGGAYLNKPGRPLFLLKSKYPARLTHYDDGKLVNEEQTLELRYFNRFDDALFAEPKA
jgi:hypothetical protein